MARRRKPVPIPRRIKPLQWRQPALVWTPIALAMALGWPAFLLNSEAGFAPAMLIAGAVAFAAGLVSMGVAWMIGKPPRSRRVVLLHIVLPGAIAAFAAPFVLGFVLRLVAQAQNANAPLPDGMWWAAAPMALLVGLPTTLFSALVFSIVALSKPPREA